MFVAEVAPTAPAALPEGLVHLFAADLFGRRGAVCIEHHGNAYLLARSPTGDELVLTRVRRTGEA